MNRLARLPLLLAYTLMLVASPLGEAGFLWVHLASAHGAASVPFVAARSRHEAPRPADEAPHGHTPSASRTHEPAAGHADAAHEHAHGNRHTHAHELPVPAPAAPADEPAAVAPDEPHRHGGMVHDHRSHPAGEIGAAASTLSRFYLPPSVTSPLPLPGHARVELHTVHAPIPVTRRVVTPPPRVPG